MKNPSDRTLSKDEIDRILTYVRSEAEQGDSCPQYRESALGLWTMVGNFINVPDGLFRLHRGAHEETVRWQEAGMPFAFVPVSMNVLDAYATSILAARVWIPDGKEIVLSCQLERAIGASSPILPTPDLWICLAASSEGEPCSAIPLGILDLLQSLPKAIATKEMNWGFQTSEQRPGIVQVSSSTGCVIRMGWPGQMIASKVPYLGKHPTGEWPRATIRFVVTQELRAKATKIVAFLLSDPPASACGS